MTKEERVSYNKRWREKHKKEIAAYNKEYTEQHRKEKALRDAKSYAKHREERAIKGKKYREVNKEAIALRRKQFLEKNREKLLNRRKQYRMAYPEKLAAQDRKKNYNLSDADYKALLKKQQLKCAMCGEILKKPKVDHDHKTGKVRGILCQRCNLDLRLLDAPALEKAAIKYLEAFETIPIEERITYSHYKTKRLQDYYVVLKNRQNCRCAICGEEKQLCMDHDHVTGYIRGLLCKLCNAELRILDDPIRYAAALNYLKR